MKTVLYCGFQPVNLANISGDSTDRFRLSVLRKARKLIEAGHVDSVREDIGEDGFSTIFGNCLPQTSIRKPTYKIRLRLTRDRKIAEGHCSCKAGVIANCKHTAAVVFYINETTTDSKTNKKQEWGIPSTKIDYGTFQTIEKMFPVEETSVVAPNYSLQQIMSKFPDLDCPLATIFKVEQRCEVETTCKSVIHDLINTLCLNELQDVLSQLLNKSVNFMPYYNYKTELINGKLRIKKCSFVLNGENLDFYEKHVKLSRDEIIRLAISTVNQSSDESWHRIRNIRIPSSTCHNIITRKDSYDTLASRLKSKVFKGNEATNYGHQLEKAARLSYAFKNNVKVINCGVVICEEFPFICCSPDGIICTPDPTLLEIKCPFSRKGQLLYERGSHKSYVPYVSFDGKKWILKKKPFVFFSNSAGDVYS